MSAPFGQKTHVSADDGKGPDVTGRSYSVRVVRANAGATIAFNDPDNKLAILAAGNYPFPKGGWEKIYLTGNVSIEYALDPGLHLETVAPPQDANGNQAIIGAAADGAAAVGPAVLVAGKDQNTAFVRTIEVVPETQPIANVGLANVLIVGGADGAGARPLGLDTSRRLKTVPRAADWAITNTSAAAGTATATKAAAGGVRHVCKTLAASIGAGAAAQGPLNAVLRDGATGVGAILHSGELAAPANTGDSYTPAQLDQVGTSGNAMTAEFTAAGAANTVQTVNVAGYDLNAND